VASADEIGVQVTEVHSRLAGLASLMVRHENDELGRIRREERVRGGDYESRRRAVKVVGDLFETFAGIEKDIFTSAKELAFATTARGDNPDGWNEVPADFPSVSLMLERLSIVTGFGGRFDSA
jgi:hypothetical protein